MLWLRFCTGFFGVGGLFLVLAGALRWSSTAVTGGGLMAVGWRLGGVVGLCRVKVGSGRGVFSFLALVWLGLGAYEVERVMNKSCADGEMVGRFLAEIWREWREWRKSRVKAGDNFFSGRFLLRFCIGFSVPGVWSRLWRVVCDGHRLL